MQLKRLLVNPVSAFLFAACAVSASAFAHADTIGWTNWSTATSGNPGSASGTIGTINVTYSGQTSGSTNVPSWTPASTFTGGVVGNAPPHTPTIQIEGGSAITETITFSSTVVDPIFAIWSLGQPGLSATFDFSTKSGQPFSILGGGPSAEFGGSALTSTGSVVHGFEGNGARKSRPADLDHSAQLRQPRGVQLARLRARQLGQQRVQNLHVVRSLERGRRDDRGAADFCQGEFEFAEAIGGIDGDENEPGLGGGKLRQRPFGPVQRPHADSIAWYEPEREQAGGQRLNAPGKFLPGPADAVAR